MQEKKYPLWNSVLENNTINMTNSEFTMNTAGFNVDNVIRNNIFDMINSTVRQNSYGFSCRNIMDNNKFRLRGLKIEQSCVIIMKEKGFKRPQIKTYKRIIKGK